MNEEVNRPIDTVMYYFQSNDQIYEKITEDLGYFDTCSIGRKYDQQETLVGH